MITVNIDGKLSPITGDNLPRIIDLVEVVKDCIEPGKMVTNILVNGRPLKDEEWDISPKHFGDAVLDITTDTPEQYIMERMPKAPEVIDQCFMMFRETRKSFMNGDSRGGNELLRAAVANLQAFVDWYKVMLELMNSDQKERFSIDSEITVMTRTLERICLQQLTQSWSSTGDTIYRDLEPQLDDLHSRLITILKEEQRILAEEQMEVGESFLQDRASL